MFVMFAISFSSLNVNLIRFFMFYLSACSEEVKMAAAACGKKNVHELNKNDLKSLSLLIKEITGIPLV